MRENRRSAVGLATAILLLQFLTVPGLEDIDKAGKLFVFVFAVLFFALISLVKKSEFDFSHVSTVLVLIWAVLLASATQAFVPGWAVIQVFIFASFVVYLILLTDFSYENSKLIDCLNSGLLLFGLLAALLGLYEYFSFALSGPNEKMLIPYLLPPNLSSRVSGMYGQPNLFALFLSLVILAYFYRYLHVDNKTVSWLLAPFRFLPFLLVALVFFLTGSRSGFLSLSLVLGFLFWLVASRRYLSHDVKGRRELYCLASCLVVAFAISSVLSSSGVGLGGRSIGAVGLSSDARFVFWMSSLLIFLDNPWLGVGLDNFGFVHSAYGPPAHKILGFVPYEAMASTNSAHNELLQVLSEGGVIVFSLLIILLLLLSWKVWKNFICNKTIDSFFLYSHLFIFPFIIQSMFSWPLRSPALLILFFSFLGILISQYPLKKIGISSAGRIIAFVLIFLGLCVVSVLFYQELRMEAFKKSFVGNSHLETTLDDFSELVSHPYSSYRVLSKALPAYSREALAREDISLAASILPYYEQLSVLEGARWQWYNLARLYLKVGREKDAHIAIQRAIDLMPSDQLPWAFQHYLNMLQAARDTGRPLESFFPRGKRTDFNVLELMHE